MLGGVDDGKQSTTSLMWSVIYEIRKKLKKRKTCFIFWPVLPCGKHYPVPIHPIYELYKCFDWVELYIKKGYKLSENDDTFELGNETE